MRWSRRLVPVGCLATALMAIAGALLLYLESTAPTLRRPLNPPEMGQSDRHCFAAVLPPETPSMGTFAWPYRMAPFDGMSAPTASPHRVLEEGRLVGPPHSQHLHIAERGGGAFSFWGGAVYFSSSDNSDPRHNGRRYEVELFGELHPLGRFASRALLAAAGTMATLLACGAANAAISSVQRQRRWSKVGAAAGLAALALSLGALAWAGFAKPVTLTIEPHRMSPGGGHAVTVSLEPLLTEASRRLGPLLRPGPSNRPEAPAGSRLRVRCDGERLARPDTQFAEISMHGGGRYVVWADVLAFASPDGRDPRQDGRLYELEIDARPAWWLLRATGMLGLLGVALLAASCPARLWRIALPAIAMFLAASILGLVLAKPTLAWIAGVIPPACVLMALVLGLAAALSRWSTRPRPGLLAAARRVQRVGCLAVHALAGWQGLAVVAMLVGASLLHAWAPVERPAWQMGTLRAYALFQGRAEATDALGYLAGSEWVRWLGDAGAFSSRRPIYTAWLAATRALTGLDLQAMMVAHALFAACALWLALRAMARHIGAAVALAAGGICLGYLQQFLGLTLNEAFGLPLALLGIALLLPGLRRRSMWAVGVGTCAITLGLIVRPGAMFVIALLPLAAAWSFWRQERTRDGGDGATALAIGDVRRRRPLRSACAAAASAMVGIAAAAGLNAAVASGVGEPGAATNSNFGYVLYGLSVGKDWGAGVEWLRTHAAELPARAGEREQAARLIEEAMTNIRRDPSIFLGSLAWAVQDFALTGIPQTSTYYADRGLLPMGRHWWTNSALLVWGLAGPLALVLRRRGHIAVVPLLLAGLAGVLLAVPLIWRDGHWRALAATVPLQAMIATFFLAPRRAPTLAATADRGPAMAGGLLGIAILACVAVAVGVVGRDTSALPKAVAAGGPAVFTHPGRMVCAEIAPNARFRWRGASTFTLDEVRQSLADWGVEESLECLLAQVDPAGPAESPAGDPQQVYLLAQAIGVGEGAGLIAAMILVPPELVNTVRQNDRDLVTLDIEWCGETIYLGRLGVLRGVGP